MIELENHFISTYTNALLSDWKVAAGILREETAWMKDIIQSEESKPDPLLASQINQQQINDALNGPFQHFFRAHLHAYATIAKIESALTILKEEFFKEGEYTTDTIYGLSTTFLNKIESSTLKQLREKCDALTKQHHADWKTHIQNWRESLLAELKKNNLLLSEPETQDFAVNETITELHNRFLDLKLGLPKLSKTPFDFNQYFTLKSALAIQSALARMQQLHTEKEIDAKLKYLSSIFKSIGKAEKELIETQKKALAELVAPIKIK